jgi:hypothetical protein
MNQQEFDSQLEEIRQEWGRRNLPIDEFLTFYQSHSERFMGLTSGDYRKSLENPEGRESEEYASGFVEYMKEQIQEEARKRVDRLFGQQGLEQAIFNSGQEEQPLLEPVSELAARRTTISRC